MAERLPRVFGSRVRDELLAIERFETLTEAQVMVADWREDYNQHQPRSSLGMMAPTRFAAGWRLNAETAERRNGETAKRRRQPPRAPGQRAADRLTARGPH